ncbi:3'-5' exonuclease [Streptomyces sanyensis]|uniref:3'-5' exonuclease n=1 Tax=Streptomyces sanyensis TaxID=568869 RepID=UPI0031ED687C
MTIDFETLNRHGASAWEVGMLAVNEDWDVEDVFDRLIRPDERYLEREDWGPGYPPPPSEWEVQAQPFRTALEDMLTFIDERLLVAHYRASKIEVVEQMCAVARRLLPDLEFLCSLEIARAVWPTRSGESAYALDHLANDLGLEHQPTHRALDDAWAVYDLIGRAADTSDLDSCGTTMQDLLQRTRVTTVRLGRGRLPEPKSPDDLKRFARANAWRNKQLNVPTEATPDWFTNVRAGGPLDGHNILISGNPGGISQSDWKEALARIGALATNQSGKNTMFCSDGLAQGRIRTLATLNAKKQARGEPEICTVTPKELLGLLHQHVR